MKILNCLCALSLGITLVSQAQTFPPVANAKLLSCDGMPCVDALANGKHLRLAIDTGNPTSFLDLKAAQSLGLTLAPVNGADGKPIADYSQTKLTTLIFGDVTFKELKYAVADLSGPIAAKTFPNIDGTIGYSAFKDRILQLNTPDSVLSVSQPLTAPTTCPSTCGDIALITFGDHGPPIVTSTGFTVNGKPITVQIDTMYTGTLLVFPTSVDKLGLTAESQSKTSNFFGFTDGGVEMFVSQAHQLGFGARTLATSAPLYFAGPKVHLPDGLFDGTVGAELLSPHKITFDFRDNKFWID
jgi:Aspartyl protease